MAANAKSTNLADLKANDNNVSSIDFYIYIYKELKYFSNARTNEQAAQYFCQSFITS